MVLDPNQNQRVRKEGKFNNEILTCFNCRSISAARMTMGPLTAYSTSITRGFKFSIVNVFGAVWPFVIATDIVQNME